MAPNPPTHSSRRDLGRLAAAAALLGASPASAHRLSQAALPHGDDRHQREMREHPPLVCGLLLFPELTALDLVAPQLLMATMMNTEVHLVASSLDPVRSGSGLSIVPTRTYDGCPRDLDILFVPGGPSGTRLALGDDALLDFVADRGARAKYVTSVCTGSVLLAAAGLLEGYRAASYWPTRDILPMFGAIPVDARVVVDRNRITGGGITAGIDFGLMLSARLRGEETARLQELLLEYDPEPPFGGGTPSTARPDTLALARSILSREVAAIGEAAASARSRRFSG